jgi:hypothetical protein
MQQKSAHSALAAQLEAAEAAKASLQAQLDEVCGDVIG